MKGLIAEYQDIILNVVASALFFVLMFIILSVIYKMCTLDLSFLIQ